MLILGERTKWETVLEEDSALRRVVDMMRDIVALETDHTITFGFDFLSEISIEMEKRFA
jgi:hypothetical protein